MDNIKELKKSELYRNIKFPECIPTLERMAELIMIGCEEKKTRGGNYLKITGKDSHRNIMRTIGFTEEKDLWISRDYISIAMKLVEIELGWKDVLKHEIDIDKMIIYGKLKWIHNVEPHIVNSLVRHECFADNDIQGGRPEIYDTVVENYLRIIQEHTEECVMEYKFNSCDFKCNPI